MRLPIVRAMCRKPHLFRSTFGVDEAVVSRPLGMRGVMVAASGRGECDTRTVCLGAGSARLGPSRAPPHRETRRRPSRPEALADTTLDQAGRRAQDRFRPATGRIYACQAPTYLTHHCPFLVGGGRNVLQAFR